MFKLCRGLEAAQRDRRNTLDCAATCVNTARGQVEEFFERLKQRKLVQWALEAAP